MEMNNRDAYESTVVDDFDHGTIHKEFSHCAKEYLSYGTHYRIRFPRTATVDQKTLLLAAAMMMDMNYYDRKSCLPFVPC